MLDVFAPFLKENKVLVVDYPGHLYSPLSRTKIEINTFSDAINK